jgi:glycosyltransferase involved in cell wall biosynthesis
MTLNNSKVKILFFIEQHLPSRFYEAYFQEFSTDRHFEFYILNLQSCNELEMQLKPYVKTYYSLEKGANYRKAFPYIRQVIKKIKPDIIHAHETIPAFYASVANLFTGNNTKVLYHRHHSFYHNYKKRIMDQVAFLFCKKVLCVSEFSKSQAASDHPFFRSKLIRVYNGVKLTDEEPGPKERAWLQKINADANYKILFLAKLKPRKGHLLSIDVIKQVTRSCAHVTLYIAGDGELKDTIQNYINEQGMQEQVQLTGALSAIKLLLSAVDMVILPSESEAFSLTVLETLCAGRLLVASDLPSIKEIIVNRETGVLINPYDREAWVKEICFYINNEAAAKAIGEKGKILFQENFIMSKMTDTMKKIYGQ